MNVKTIWATPDGDSLLGYIARVSNPQNQDNPEVSGLIKYMLRKKHWSPFEMVSMCVEVETTRDIGRQILRHRSFSFSEFSQRYCEVDERIVTRECRMQDKKNRQSSIPCDDVTITNWWQDAFVDVGHGAIQYYQEALEKGIAKEVARALLPEGLTPTKMYVAGPLRSFIHYCIVRMDESTQKEHREIAIAIGEEVNKSFPITWAAVKQYYLDDKGD